MGYTGGNTMSDNSLFLALMIMAIAGFVIGIFAGFSLAMKGDKNNENG